VLDIVAYIQNLPVKQYPAGEASEAAPATADEVTK